VQAASVITNSDTPLESRKAFFSSKDTLGAMAMKVHAWGTDIEPEGAAAVGVTTPSPGILPLYVERHEKSVICMVGAAVRDATVESGPEKAEAEATSAATTAL